MSKIKQILELYETEFYWEKSTIINALISTLSGREAIALFDLQHDYFLRRSTLRRIAKDMEDNFTVYHKELIQKIVVAFDILLYNQKKSCSHALGYLYPYLPEEQKVDVVTFGAS